MDIKMKRQRPEIAWAIAAMVLLFHSGFAFAAPHDILSVNASPSSVSPGGQITISFSSQNNQGANRQWGYMIAFSKNQCSFNTAWSGVAG